MDQEKSNSRPMQILGPPLNGRNSQDSRRDSHRDGLNSSTSGPYTSCLRCRPNTLYMTGVPFGTKRGDLPSTPPPLGRIVSQFATRELTGTGGNSLSAAKSRQNHVSLGNMFHRVACARDKGISQGVWVTTHIH